MFRRETIIALRARHQAFRIAVTILYPILHVPPPIPAAKRSKRVPDSNLRHDLTREQMEILRREAHRRHQMRERMRELVTLAIVTISLVGMVCIMIWQSKP
jgi:hypothetical protein